MTRPDLFEPNIHMHARTRTHARARTHILQNLEGLLYAYTTINTQYATNEYSKSLYLLRAWPGISLIRLWKENKKYPITDLVKRAGYGACYKGVLWSPCSNIAALYRKRKVYPPPPPPLYNMG